MQPITLTKKDFKIEWYSGQGAGGQHRNKHQNCCRITHLESGITVNGTESRSRVENQKAAFEELAKRLQRWYNKPMEREISNEVIRTYHAERNEVIDKASGLRQPFKDVVLGADISDMIEARRKQFGENDA
jgi:protein subunit release factor A